MNFLNILISTLFVHQVWCQTVTTTTTSSNIPCSSAYSNPVLNGTCLPSSECLGATLTGICPHTSHVCCIPDPQLTTEAGENSFITLNRYLKFVGDTTRNRRFYYLFKRSIADAGITTCHAASAYFAQLLGETGRLQIFEERNGINQDINPSIGNDSPGDGVKYRGRGALLLRGKQVYLNATQQIPSKPLRINIYYRYFLTIKHFSN